MYAIVECGGRQYRAEEGHTFSVEKLSHEVGDQITLNNVYLLSNGAGVQIGQPTVEGVSILATVTEQYRGKKIFVWKYKPKKRYRRRRGHRQSYTRLRIDSIVTGGQAAAAEPVSASIAALIGWVNGLGSVRPAAIFNRARPTLPKPLIQPMSAAIDAETGSVAAGPAKRVTSALISQT